MYYYRPARGSVHESMRKLKTFKTKKRQFLSVIELPRILDDYPETEG